MFRRAASWLAQLALVLQLAVPLWHVPPAVAAMLCPEHMLQRGVDGNASPSAPKPALPKPGKSCPVCQVAQAGGTALLPAPAAIAVPVEFSYLRFQPPSDDRVVGPAAPHPSSRGPPAV
jgi:hypothetical protein